MRTIKANLSNTIIVNKSTFITELIKIKDVNNVQTELDKIKQKYKDATHYCYAYIIDDRVKSSDDGEPGGTAGVPMMEVLNKFELNYVLCVVIRYFGGIKLGAGGLVRTYRKSVIDAIKKAELIELIEGFYIEFETPYDRQNEIEIIIKDYLKEYNDKVTYKANCTKEEKELIEAKFNIKKVENKKIER